MTTRKDTIFSKFIVANNVTITPVWGTGVVYEIISERGVIIQGTKETIMGTPEFAGFVDGHEFRRPRYPRREEISYFDDANRYLSQYRRGCSAKPN